MIPGFDFIQFAQSTGPLVVLLVAAIIIFSESGLLIGFFLPGDSLLFTLGFLIQNNTLDISIHLAVIVLFIAAMAGDNVGYTFGRKIGPRLFKRPNSLLFRQENIAKAQEFYEKHGAKTIVLARFVPVIRTFAPLIAGVAKMNYRTFFTFNIIGAALWAAGITYLGYFLGQLLHSIGIEIDTIILPIIVAVLIISVAPAAYHLLKDKKQRQAIWNATKLEWQKIVERKK